MRVDLWNVLEPVVVDPARKSWKDVLRNLVYHANTAGEAWPSIETIRRECGYKSRKAVIDALAGLKGIGIIYPMPDAPGGGGRSKVTKWMLKNLLTGVDKLVDNSSMLERDEMEKGEATSREAEKGEATSKKGEATSQNGEATSHRIDKKKKEVSKLVSVSGNSEATSPFVNNLAKKAVAPSALNESSGGKRAPKAMSIEQVFPELKKTRTKEYYFEMCSVLGWRPNDPEQTPKQDAELARQAIVACALRERLSLEEAKRFLRYNAKRKWAAIDQASCVKDLAKEWCEAWKRRDFDAYSEEQEQRREARRRREEEMLRARVAAEKSGV